MHARIYVPVLVTYCFHRAATECGKDDQDLSFTDRLHLLSKQNMTCPCGEGVHAALRIRLLD